MRVTEVDGDTGILEDFGVLRHLTSLVIRHALPCSQRHAIQRRAEALYSRGGSRIVHLRQNQVTACEFDEGADSRCIVLALDQVAFPVARKFTFLHLWRAEVNADHVRNLAAPVDLTTTRLAGRFSLSQTMDQFLSQLTDGQRVDGAVDRFSADVSVSKVMTALLQV